MARAARSISSRVVYTWAEHRIAVPRTDARTPAAASAARAASASRIGAQTSDAPPHLTPSRSASSRATSSASSNAPVGVHFSRSRSDSTAPIQGIQARDTSSRRASDASVSGPPK